MAAPSVMPIAAVGVVVPAHNEEDHIGRCLESILTALASVSVQTAVCVVLDRCTDRTAERAAAVDGTHTTIGLLPQREQVTIGALRNRGAGWLLDHLGEHAVSAVWLLSTDADTTVTPGWVRDHLGHAESGAHAVAGLADLDDPTELSPAARLAYARIVREGTHRDGHLHAYGANLGIRGDVFRSVGGFPEVPHGEDHGLVARVRQGGHRLVTALDGRVCTSARTRGRAVDGLADLLAGL